MAEAVASDKADIVLMGIEPSYPSSKYGYIVPDRNKDTDGMMPVERFTEKPNVSTAKKLIAEGVLWNGGIFVFNLGYLMEIALKFLHADFSTMTKSPASITTGNKY